MPDASAPLDPKAPVSAGDVIADKYVIEGVVAVGGMGVVLRAWHRDLEQRVAIKVMLRELAANPEAEARFLREARASVKLRSEHVARVFDVARLPSGEPYMVMEFLEGRDLSAVLAERGPLPVEEAVDLLLQAAEAVAEAHAAGIVHRDLKPPNLFLTRDAYGAPVIKVLDFGISKLHQPDSPNTGPGLTGISVVMGTPNYMSPEQMRSARSADARSDVWSLGAILYELLTGKLAFEGEGLTEVIAAVLTQPTPRAKLLRAEVPEALDEVIGRCLHKDPESRFASIAELVHAAASFGSARARVSQQRVKLAPDSALARKSAPTRPALQIVTTDDDDARPAVHSQPTHVAWGNAPGSGTDPEQGPKKRSALAMWVTGTVVLIGVAAAWFGFRHSAAAGITAGADEARSLPTAQAPAALPPSEPLTGSVASPAVESSAVKSEAAQNPVRHGPGTPSPRARESVAASQPAVVPSAPPRIAASSQSAAPSAARPPAPAASAEPPAPQPTAAPPPPARTITDFGGRE